MSEQQPPVEPSQAEIEAAQLRREQRVSDALFMTGMVLVFTGIGLMHVPSALIALGSSLVFLAVKRERRP